MSEALEIIPKEIIRTETALSRFPIHRLSKSGKVTIEIKVRNSEGELTTKWNVKNPPDPIGYKIDTLVINRKIEEAGKPIPKLIKLGSLTEIAEEVGLKNTRNTDHIKNAIIQNVGAVISAKFTYKTIDGTEKRIELADTRYGAIFTGEELPNGNRADATYIILHDLYREILNTAPTRPLDYEYLKELTPITQRLYELLSYQIYGALENKRVVAKMLYSEFCTYAPQTRFFDWEQVRPQMYRVHKPHLESGYIESVRFEKVRDDDGTPDWLFIYTAGRKAKGEHTFATRRGGYTLATRIKKSPKTKEIISNPGQLLLIPDDPTPPLVPELELIFTDEEEKLISEVRKFRVSEKKARELVKSRKEAVEREIIVFPARLVGTDIKNPSGLFVKAVEDNYEPPQVFFELQKVEENKRRTDEERKKIQQTKKIENEKNEAWFKAKKRLLEMSEEERNSLWEANKKQILESEEYKNADQVKLRVLGLALDGMIQAKIIESFINLEK